MGNDFEEEEEEIFMAAGSDNSKLFLGASAPAWRGEII